MQRITTGLITLGFLFCLASNAQADAFQLTSQSRQATAVEAAVYFRGELLGYTNSQGIIFILTPQGSNTFRVEYMGQSFDITLTITGALQVQPVNIP